MPWPNHYLSSTMVTARCAADQKKQSKKRTGFTKLRFFPFENPESSNNTNSRTNSRKNESAAFASMTIRHAKGFTPFFKSPSTSPYTGFLFPFFIFR